MRAIPAKDAVGNNAAPGCRSPRKHLPSSSDRQSQTFQSAHTVLGLWQAMLS